MWLLLLCSELRNTLSQTVDVVLITSDKLTAVSGHKIILYCVLSTSACWRCSISVWLTLDPDDSKNTDPLKSKTQNQVNVHSKHYELNIYYKINWLIMKIVKCCLVTFHHWLKCWAHIIFNEIMFIHFVSVLKLRSCMREEASLWDSVVSTKWYILRITSVSESHSPSSSFIYNRINNWSR